MAQFSYKAIGRDGKSVEGTLDAAGIDLASRALRSQGLTLLALESGSSGNTTSVAPLSGKAPGRQEILSMTSELAVLLRAGLPLDKALKVLIDMASEPAMNELMSQLLKEVKGGKSFSSALEPHENIFGSFYINMVRSGEASGHMSSVLERLVEYLDNAKQTREAVVSALIYPAILVCVSIISVAGMLGFVVPQFETLFADMGEALPLMTRMVISFSDFVKSWGLLLIAVVVGAGMYLRSWAVTPEGKAALDQRMLNMPLAGSVIFELEVSKFAATVGTLLSNGVSLLKAISIAIDTVDNHVIKEALQVLPPAVKAGKRMSVALENTGMFTPMVIQMIRVGEESGSLDSMMLELARVFDGHVQSGIKRSLTVLEPALILIMGFCIAVIIISILLGILSVNDLAV